jgi:hypothetical protein
MLQNSSLTGLAPVYSIHTDILLAQFNVHLMAFGVTAFEKSITIFNYHKVFPATTTKKILNAANKSLQPFSIISTFVNSTCTCQNYCVK